MWPILRAAVVGMLCVAMASCGWLGCRKKPKDYSKALPPGETALVKIDPKDYPDFGTGFRNREGLVQAIDHSLEWYKHPSSKTFFPYKVINDPQGISHERCIATLEAFKKVLGEAKDATDLQRIITERYDVYMSRGCDELGTVLFTGYCTPIFKGSLVRTPDYNYPLYKRPPDLETRPDDGTPLGRRTDAGETVPYYTRREIETQQLLAGKGLELVWLKSVLEVHIIHVQGSAKIELGDGTMFNVGYHGKTDRPYGSVGLALVADKKIAPDDLSLSKMIEYFDKHPHEMKTYVYKNDSYVFFQRQEGEARGSLNVPVTPYRSIATDKAVFPRGLLSYAVTKAPRLSSGGQVTLEPFYSFTLDQDTGGAIRSAGRCDIYMGVGPDAMNLAGRTRAEGKLYYLAIK
ncbi:MAG: murein transglycosylase [Planctomycetes bacterium]|nr:murein transglycosylase [Planctomycetota bacterium]